MAAGGTVGKVEAVRQVGKQGRPIITWGTRGKAGFFVFPSGLVLYSCGNEFFALVVLGMVRIKSKT